MCWNRTRAGRPAVWFGAPYCSIPAGIDMVKKAGKRENQREEERERDRGGGREGEGDDGDVDGGCRRAVETLR